MQLPIEIAIDRICQTANKRKVTRYHAILNFRTLLSDMDAQEIVNSIKSTVENTDNNSEHLCRALFVASLLSKKDRKTLLIVFARAEDGPFYTLRLRNTIYRAFGAFIIRNCLVYFSDNENS